MAERHLIVDNLKFSYEGLFNSTELYNLISGWFFDKSWDWYEKINEEQNLPSGKQITILLEPWKNTTDYYRLVIRLKLNLIDVQEVQVEHKGENLNLNQGLIRMTFDGYVVSDRKQKWQDKPFYWFLGYVLEKYFFRQHFTKAQIWLESDIDDLHTKIKDYLNVFKYTYQH